MNHPKPGPTENIDPLDALLREAQPYIDDGGFTARVVAELPPRRSQNRRLYIHVTTLALCLALGLWQIFSGPDFALAWPRGFSPLHWRTYPLMLPLLSALLPLAAVASYLAWVYYDTATKDEKLE